MKAVEEYYQFSSPFGVICVKKSGLAFSKSWLYSLKENFVYLYVLFLHLEGIKR